MFLKSLQRNADDGCEDCRAAELDLEAQRHLAIADHLGALQDFLKWEDYVRTHAGKEGLASECLGEYYDNVLRGSSFNVAASHALSEWDI